MHSTSYATTKPERIITRCFPICLHAFQPGICPTCPYIPPSNYHRSIATTAMTNVSCMQVGFMHVAKNHLQCTLPCAFCLAGGSGAHALLESMDPDVSVLDILIYPNGR
jgi:hypothetical protein